MPDEPKQDGPKLPNFELLVPPEGAPNIYANLSHLSWSGMDITVKLYQLVQRNRDIPGEIDKPNQVLQVAAVTFSWASAKAFHNVLTDVLQRYEKVYGPITTEFKPI